MQIPYKNQRLENILIGLNVGAAVLVVTSFVALFGFDRPLVQARFLYATQMIFLTFFVIEKIIRTLNTESLKDYWRLNWFELPILLGLIITLLGRQFWFEPERANTIAHMVVGGYLIMQVVIKVCRTTVTLAAKGKNPTRMLLASFVVLIVVGAGLLCLPEATTGRDHISFVDALFTSTSAACVTGLVVKDTGQDFTFMGQCVILTLIQLGGLGIVVFGAVFAMMLGQAFSVRESAAMQDLLSAQTLNHLGNLIAFIFMATLVIEAAGAFGLYHMWSSDPTWQGGQHKLWYYSIFHSVSAFCNAGFGLFNDSLMRYPRSGGVILVICPLIVLGGLGFSVLYNLCNVGTDRMCKSLLKLFNKRYRLNMAPPKRVTLQSKIVLSMSLILIVLGALLFMGLERTTNLSGEPVCAHPLDALFQSITARTAGFNTVDIANLTDASKMVTILLMIIGGSPGSTAGGIKTVTLAVILMSVLTTLRKRGEVEMFKRSVSVAVVGRALTVTLLFIGFLCLITLALMVTERGNLQVMTLSDILFESASALGTVGLSTGITPFLTTAGKYLVIIAMLIGRLGPLTLVAALTVNITPARYSYPQESIMVG